MMTRHDDPWSDVLVAGDAERTITYRAGLAVYEESSIKGQFVRRGWNAAGFVNFYDGRINPSVGHGQPRPAPPQPRSHRLAAGDGVPHRDGNRITRAAIANRCGSRTQRLARFGPSGALCARDRR